MVLTVKGGHGGNGCIHFLREKFREEGPPDGGTGGNGGNVYLQADQNISNLNHLRNKYVAQNGGKGAKLRATGKNGEDITVLVPVGTVVHQWLEEPQKVGGLVVDLKEPGQKMLLAPGGKGGKGNASFASSVDRSPKNAEEGQPTDYIPLYLDYQIVADVAFIGFPNAGKSSLLASLTNALPKIASYPFTTVNPYVGTITHTSIAPTTTTTTTTSSSTVTVGKQHSAKEGDGILIADLPGLVEGAHINKGKGHSFLKHLQRVKVICYVIDLAPKKTRAMKQQETHSFIQMSPIKAFDTLRDEIQLYDPNLLLKPSLVVANKIDLAPSFQALNKLLGHLHTYHPQLSLIPVSAKKSLNLFSLKETLFSFLYPLNSNNQHIINRDVINNINNNNDNNTTKLSKKHIMDSTFKKKHNKSRK